MIMDIDTSKADKVIRMDFAKEKHSDLDANTVVGSVSCGKLFLDACFTYLYIGPLVVGYWFSTWMLNSTVLLSHFEETISIAISAAIGYCIAFLATCLQQNLINFTSRRSAPMQFVVKRCYTYILAFAYVSQWRSLWQFLDVYTSVSVKNALVSMLASLAAMLLLRSCRSILAPPAFIQLDFDLKEHFTISTFANQNVGTVKHVADSFFSVFIINSFMIAMWRGLWELTDFLLSPDDSDMSAIYSLVISYSLVVVTLSFRRYMMFLSIWLERKHYLLKLVFEDIVVLIHFIYVVLHWRGFWILMDTHILEPPTRYWVCHSVSFVALILCWTSNSLMPRGCPRDGSFSKGEGLLLDMHYISNLSEWCSQQKTQTFQRIFSPCSHSSALLSAFASGTMVILGWTFGFYNVFFYLRSSNMSTVKDSESDQNRSTPV